MVIDAVVSRRKALKVCFDIQQHQGGKARTPILLIAAPADTDAVRRAFNLGASDALLFVAACNEMTERARNLGPNPLKKEMVKAK